MKVDAAAIRLHETFYTLFIYFERQRHYTAADILHHTDSFCHETKQWQQFVFSDACRNIRVVTLNTTAVIDHNMHSLAGNNHLPSSYMVDFILLRAERASRSSYCFLSLQIWILLSHVTR